MRTLADVELDPRDRAAILEAAASLRELSPVTRVVLFGSKAAATDGPDSDIDLLVLTSTEPDTAFRDRVSDALFEINLEHDVLLSAIVVSEHEWANGLTSRARVRQEIEERGCLV